MLSEIHNRYDQLTDTERKIADTVLIAPQDAVKMTVKELAQRSGTVPSAVVRFCKSIGAKGFSDFKICLSAELGGKASAASMLPVSDGDAPQQVFEKVFASNSEEPRKFTDFIPQSRALEFNTEYEISDILAEV